MSLPTKRNEKPASTYEAPMELRNLALLELKRRQLLSELAEVDVQYEQLSREIDLKRIPIPWMTQH
jgi:hypothetical protein